MTESKGESLQHYLKFLKSIFFLVQRLRYTEIPLSQLMSGLIKEK